MMETGGDLCFSAAAVRTEEGGVARDTQSRGGAAVGRVRLRRRDARVARELLDPVQRAARGAAHWFPRWMGLDLLERGLEFLGLRLGRGDSRPSSRKGFLCKLK